MSFMQEQIYLSFIIVCIDGVAVINCLSKVMLLWHNFSAKVYQIYFQLLSLMTNIKLLIVVKSVLGNQI